MSPHRNKFSEHFATPNQGVLVAYESIGVNGPESESAWCRSIRVDVGLYFSLQGFGFADFFGL
jgi:hypothetical protein